jgi:hypothetical protein
MDPQGALRQAGSKSTGLSGLQHTCLDTKETLSSGGPRSWLGTGPYLPGGQQLVLLVQI